MRLVTCCLSLVLLVNTGVTRADSSAALEEVLVLSGLTEQLESTPEQFREAFRQAASEAQLPPDFLRKALGSVERTVRAQLLLDEIRIEAQRTLSEKEITTLGDWYRSAPGKRIVEQETAASTPQTAQRMMTQMEELLSNPELVTTAQRIDALVGATDMAVELHMFTSAALFTAITLSRAPEAT